MIYTYSDGIIVPATSLDPEKAALELLVCRVAKTPEDAARLAFEVVEAVQLEAKYKTGDLPRPAAEVNPEPIATEPEANPGTGIGFVIGKPVEEEPRWLSGMIQYRGYRAVVHQEIANRNYYCVGVSIGDTYIPKFIGRARFDNILEFTKAQVDSIIAEAEAGK